MQFAGTPTVYIFTSLSLSLPFPVCECAFPSLIHPIPDYSLFPLWKPLCICARAGKKGETMHSIVISSIYVDSFSQRCFLRVACCYCCFLCGFISAVGCYFRRINTFKLPKLTFSLFDGQTDVISGHMSAAAINVQIIPPKCKRAIHIRKFFLH